MFPEKSYSKIKQHSSDFSLIYSFGALLAKLQASTTSQILGGDHGSNRFVKTLGCIRELSGFVGGGR